MTPVINAYALAVEQDRLIMQAMLKTMTPEQVNRFCFENGFAVPEPSKTNRQVDALQDGECPCCHGSWPSPDATQCNGCGYELDEEEE